MTIIIVRQKDMMIVIIRQKDIMIVIVLQKDMMITIVEQISTTIVTDKARVPRETTNLGMTTAKVDTR